MHRIARTLLFGLATVTAASCLLAQAPTAPAKAPAAAPNLVGTWGCQVDYNGSSIAVGVHLAKSDSGGLTATLDNVMDPGGPAMEASATFQDGSLHIDVPSIPSSFDGKLNAAGDTIEGGWAMDGGSLACNLTKEPASQP